MSGSGKLELVMLVVDSRKICIARPARGVRFVFLHGQGISHTEGASGRLLKVCDARSCITGGGVMRNMHDKSCILPGPDIFAQDTSPVAAIRLYRAPPSVKAPRSHSFFVNLPDCFPASVMTKPLTYPVQKYNYRTRSNFYRSYALQVPF